MAGRKQKPCEWCETEQIFRTDYDARNVSGTLKIYPEQTFISVWFQGISDDGSMTSEDTGICSGSRNWTEHRSGTDIPQMKRLDALLL